MADIIPPIMVAAAGEAEKASGGRLLASITLNVTQGPARRALISCSARGCGSRWAKHGKRWKGCSALVHGTFGRGPVFAGDGARPRE